MQVACVLACRNSTDPRRSTDAAETTPTTGPRVLRQIRCDPTDTTTEVNNNHASNITFNNIVFDSRNNGDERVLRSFRCDPTVSTTNVRNNNQEQGRQVKNF